MQEAVLRYLSWAREDVSEGWYFGASRSKLRALGILEGGVHCGRYPSMLLGIVQTLQSISNVWPVTMCCRIAACVHAMLCCRRGLVAAQNAKNASPVSAAACRV